jgi:hypothetical protein
MNAPAAKPRGPRAEVVRFPPRASCAIWIVREGEAWLALAGPHGWSFGSREHARDAARWLSGNLGLPIREAPR